jgi:hypothetical protein
VVGAFFILVKSVEEETMFWEVELEATEEHPLPVGMGVMAVGLRRDGGIFEGVVTEVLPRLHNGYFRVIIELRNENILDRYPRRIGGNHPDNH